jgi:hypothetical protein
VFGYLGDARWASIYAVVAGATLLWTSTWWGAGLPWHGGVDPATVPDGTVAGLGLVTWAVLGSWLVLGWRTVAVEAAAAVPGTAGRGTAGRATRAAVDNPGHPVTRSATLPPGGLDPGRGELGVPGNGVEPEYGVEPGYGSQPGNGVEPSNGSESGNGSQPKRGSQPGHGVEPVGPGTSPSRGSLSLPK